MKIVRITEAKARWSEMIALAEAGEKICITRRGKPIAALIAAEGRQMPIDMNYLQAVTKTMPKAHKNAGAFIRKMRDAERY